MLGKEEVETPGTRCQPALGKPVRQKLPGGERCAIRKQKLHPNIYSDEERHHKSSAQKNNVLTMRKKEKPCYTQCL
eukprot:8896298-Prorocentrum_lima.AAC.1